MIVTMESASEIVPLLVPEFPASAPPTVPGIPASDSKPVHSKSTDFFTKIDNIAPAPTRTLTSSPLSGEKSSSPISAGISLAIIFLNLLFCYSLTEDRTYAHIYIS